MIVWPANIDSTKTRKQGRKLAKGMAIQAPRLEEIRNAAKRLSIEAELVPVKSKPGAWWEKSGYAILPRKGTKAEALGSLAAEVKKVRSLKTVTEKGK